MCISLIANSIKHPASLSLKSFTKKKNMESPGLSIESLFERVETFTKTTLELSKLKALRTTAEVVTTLVSQLSVIMMISIFFLVLNIGIALLLGELLGKSYYGFFIVAGFYLVAALVFYFFMHTWVKKPLFNLIVKKALQ